MKVGFKFEVWVKGNKELKIIVKSLVKNLSKDIEKLLELLLEKYKIEGEKKSGKDTMVE